MEHAIITKLSDLEPNYREQTAALLVDSFYDMFKGISKYRQMLLRLFDSCMQPELVYVLTQDNQVVGFVAVSDPTRRTIIIREEVCVCIFGALKGKMLAWQLGKIQILDGFTWMFSHQINRRFVYMKNQVI